MRPALKFLVLASSALVAAACASSPKVEKVAHLREIAVVIDATVLHDRTSKPSLLNVAESDAIASRLEEVAAERLRAKGYLPRPMVRTVGLGFDHAGDIEVAYDSSAASRSPSPPFALATRADNIGGAQLENLHRASAEDRLPSESSPLGSMPVLVIGARGRFISEGAVAANVGKVALGIVVIAATIAARGGNAGSGLELDEDTLDLTLKLFDPREPPRANPNARCKAAGREGVRKRRPEDAEELIDCGPLLWRARKRVAQDPDEKDFAAQLDDLLRQLPAAKDDGRVR